MKSLQFMGASGCVTGSSFLLTTSTDTKILVDFGIFQGAKHITEQNYDKLQFNPSDVDGVVVTHAHLDHCGRLPMLVFGGFSGKIYMTAPTYSLVDIVLNDAVKIAEDRSDTPPLYSQDEVDKVLEMIEVVEYNAPFQIKDTRVVLKDAGHILGSSSIKITDMNANKSIVFSGDLGNSPEDIVKPTEFFDSADYVVMEATYGDKIHPKDNPSQILGEEIQKIEESGGVLLIPAFSIERTQEILHRLHHLKKDGTIKADTPIFLDGPMGIRATTVFKDYKAYYNEELASHIDSDPFMFEGLVITEHGRDSREIAKALDPKVIIAGSGMMSGGRILSHAIRYLPDKRTRLLFVGFQAEDTLGRKILEGAGSVKIDKERGKGKIKVKVNAQVRQVKSFSAHADQGKLLTWLTHIKDVRKVFIVHSESPQRETFASKIKETTDIKDVILPTNGDTHEF